LHCRRMVVGHRLGKDKLGQFAGGEAVLFALDERPQLFERKCLHERAAQHRNAGQPAHQFVARQGEVEQLSAAMQDSAGGQVEFPVELGEHIQPLALAGQTDTARDFLGIVKFDHGAGENFLGFLLAHQRTPAFATFLVSIKYDSTPAVMPATRFCWYCLVFSRFSSS